MKGSRLRNVLVLWLVGIAGLNLAHPARAQSDTTRPTIPMALATPSSFSPAPLYAWPERFGDGLAGAADPEALRAVAEAVTDTRVASFSEQRPDLQDGATGETCVVRFINYRLPWLVTPESAVHALPTVSMGGNVLRFEFMAGAIGGRSAAFGQFVMRF
jgi:hypothetical protein